MEFHTSSNWIEELNYERSITILTGIALRHAELAGPYSNDLRRIIEESAWDQLINFAVDYSVGSVLELYHTRQALAFFQKFEQLRVGIDKSAKALQSFREAEEKCRETNVRLRAARRGDYRRSPRVESVFLLAQRKIADCLGDVPSLSDLDFSFGPGANTGVKARASSARWKLESPLQCSVELAPSVSRLLQEFPGWVQLHSSDSLLDRLESHLSGITVVDVDVVPGKLQFVPKNAKTYRSICVEPILNSIAQKGVGGYIKKRLERVNIFLSRTQTRNKHLAQKGSAFDTLATVDLSAASDTISKEIVAELLPLDWYFFLSQFRTGKVTLAKGSEPISLEKFSSMGNAYTFELETLLFWGLAVGTCSYLGIDYSDVSVFGDDIIVPKEAYPLLTEVLEASGFSINLEKSFAEGPFRESCGGDYYLGIDIRPFYQKKPVSGMTLFSLHNYYMLTCQPEMAEYVRSFIHPSLLLFGPAGYGDGHLIGDWHHAARVPKKHKEKGYGGVIFDTFACKKRSNKMPLPRGDALIPAYSIYMRGENPSGLVTDHYTVRGVKGYRKISIYTFATTVFQPSMEHEELSDMWNESS